jgi:hypothetical protein
MNHVSIFFFKKATFRQQKIHNERLSHHNNVFILSVDEIPAFTELLLSRVHKVETTGNKISSNARKVSRTSDVQG